MSMVTANELYTKIKSKYPVLTIRNEFKDKFDFFQYLCVFALDNNIEVTVQEINSIVNNIF